MAEIAYTEICLGRGEWIVGHALWRGSPCVIFTPAKVPGKPGDSAVGEIPSDRISDGAIVLRFTTMEAAFFHLDRLQLMMKAVEVAVTTWSPSDE